MSDIVALLLVAVILESVALTTSAVMTLGEVCKYIRARRREL